MEQSKIITDLLREVDVLEGEKKRIDEKIHIIKSAIAIFSEIPNSSIATQSPQLQISPDLKSKYPNYSINLKARDKVFMILKTEKRFLRIREIVLIAHQLEPETSQKELMSKLSPAVSALKVRQKVIISKQIGNSTQDVVWGAKNWIDNDGNIKEEFMYDTSSSAPRKTYEELT
jgi:hypothetical protein